MFSDKLPRAPNRDVQMLLSSQGVTTSATSHKASSSIGVTSYKQSSAKSVTRNSGQTRPSSAKPILKPPKNDSSTYFATIRGNGQLDLRASASNCDYHGYSKKSDRKQKKKLSIGAFERGQTQPGKYMEKARNMAIRRRHMLVARQGELLEKEHLYDCQLASKLATNRALDENRKLKSQLNMAHQKLHVKDNLLQDSLNCTFVACPCSQNSKVPNMSLIFKLRKKVIELRDLVAIQEVEIINMQNSVRYVKIRDLMIEIEALRALVDEKGQDPAVQNEIEGLRKQLTEANDKLRGADDLSRSKSDQLIAELRAEIQQLRTQSGDAGRETAEYKRELTELKIQLEARTKDRDSANDELKKLRLQLETMRTQFHQEKSTATSELTQKVRLLEDELRMTKSRAQISSDELSRLRTQLLEKDKRASELASQASQYKQMKQRIETFTKEIETLRQKQRDDHLKHKEEIAVYRKESMRIRQLESELKNVTRQKEKAEEQMNSHLSIAKTKLEKEQANVTKLMSELKEMSQSQSRFALIETERNDLQVKVKSYKAKISSIKERYQGMEEMQSKYEQITVQLSGKEDEILRLKIKLKQAQTRLDRQEQRLGELGGKLNEIKDTHDD